MTRGGGRGKRSLRQTLGLYQEAMRQAGQKGLPMRLRLFGFLFLFLNAIMLGVLVVLFAAGVFQGGLAEHQALLEKELAHFSQSVYQDCGALSVQTVALAEALAKGLEHNLTARGGSAGQLRDRPELLEQLLEEELNLLKGALEKSAASGVFLLLDATVNPALPDADTSRACLYLKNMEPNIVNGAEANLRFVLGPMTIARANEIAILPQWQMELDTGGLPFFREVMDTAADSALPLSRLYRWSQALTLPGGSERLLLCAAPLLSAQGEVMGLCGFEMSEMLFKLAQAPTNGDYTYLWGCLAPFDGDWLRLTGGLYAGTPPDLTGKLQDLTIAQGDGAFHSYSPGNQSAFAGLHQEISLYPADSAFAGERWATALMLPEPVLNVLVSGQNHRLTASLLILMLVDIALAAFLSRRYIRPVAAALEQLKHPAAAGRTKIPEIDDLIEFLAAEDAAAEAGAISQPGTAEEHSALYRDFVHNIGLLSKAERKVFNLYLQGHTAQEIAGILTISINTVKTHNRRIYTKLNVTTYKELMIFIAMMKEAQGHNDGPG